MNVDNFLDELEGCDFLTGRAKAAVVVMLKDGRQEMTDEDWTLGGLIMENISGLRAENIEQLRSADE